jgi:hypothetical protein
MKVFQLIWKQQHIISNLLLIRALLKPNIAKQSLSSLITLSIEILWTFFNIWSFWFKMGVNTDNTLSDSWQRMSLNLFIRSIFSSQSDIINDVSIVLLQILFVLNVLCRLREELRLI